MTTTAFDDQFAVCTPEEEEAFKAIEARQQERSPSGEASCQRERFEAWATKNKMDTSCFNGFYGDRDTFMAWEAWEVACPEGWTVVPINPAKQQIGSVFWAHEDADVYGIYADMVANAPNPEDV